MPVYSQTCAGESVNAALAHFDRAKIAEADKLINDAVAAGKCPGAVLLVGRGDEILYEKSYGHRALKPVVTPMTTDTVFDLASLTKPVATAVSIMKLFDQGRIKMDDPVAKYLPGFAANGKEKITIADLLLHVGGLMPDDDLADFSDGPAAAMSKILAAAPIYQPRSRFAYSDMGYIVLGEVVHKIDGRTIDKFVADEIYRPLRMLDTCYHPDDLLKSRCAPTEQREKKWIIGEVHDPRAFALGGVAGHAGVFSTAEDLSRFCRMILAGGKLDGVRVLKESTIAMMTTPHPVPGRNGGHRTYGFDVDTAYAGIRGDRLERGVTFGHTGFTGTAFWLDPVNHCYFILLTNAVHPDGKGKILALRHEVATVVGEALLGPSLSSPLSGTGFQPVHNAPATFPSTQPDTHATSTSKNTTGWKPVLLGIDILHRDNFQQLAGRRVGLITNQTGRDRDGNRTIDLLAHAKNVTLVRLFSPEHGIDGVLDEKIDNSTDVKTGLKIFSLYGKTQKPTPEMLEGIDTLVFDIQDVGTRFYTYISTMGLCMQAAAEHKIRFVVLDRPNPNTGLVADGPIADKAHESFIAFAPLPLVHGMTIGELARFFNAELKLNCDLQVVPMENWRRRMWWDATGLMWINPSPNLRNPSASLLYPTIGLLEATNISVGRGTDQPFEQFGAPWLDARKLADALNNAKLPGLRFVPITFEPKSSKFAGEKCQGVYVEVTDRNAFEPAKAGVTIAWCIKKEFGEKFQWAQLDKMLQNAGATKTFDAAKDFSAIAPVWGKDVEAFRTVRGKYLLYD
ncbi:MAG TPA: exo-beta-N-acetylmuramidase NamZ domain-containing protein [Tepidisphaeraceae bacterium]|nr:exo-beta-N-acetylmuramidase NamZ domain-containing protein [Tepidisphaeraceae bacterium]